MEKEKLYFYYTNDLHSNFKQWPRVAGFMKDKKEIRKAHQESYWLMDVGDHMDRVHPISEAFKGKANVQLLNNLEYDFATIGNNEGITLAHDELFHLYDEADFQVVCANLHTLHHTEPDWLERTVITESNSGIKIGVIGLTAAFNDYYELLNWHISPKFDALDLYIKDLKEQCDIIILLSHLGLTEDEEIAQNYPEIDVIIGGHTHHLLRTGKVVNRTMLTAAGKHCSFVGEVILTWDHERGELVEKEAYTSDITHYKKDVETEEALQEYNKTSDRILGIPIAKIDHPLEVKWYEDTPIMQELTHAMRNWTKADVAMLNAGMLLETLPAGTITYKDIHRICPHPINPVVVQLTGNEIMEVIRVSFTKEFMEFELKGFGFRGKVLGKMLFSGLHVETAKHPSGEIYVKRVLHDDGTELNSRKKYFVATADTFTFGRLLPEVAKSEIKQYYLPEFIRDLLAFTLKNTFAIK